MINRWAPVERRLIAPTSGPQMLVVLATLMLCTWLLPINVEVALSIPAATAERPTWGQRQAFRAASCGATDSTRPWRINGFWKRHTAATRA